MQRTSDREPRPKSKIRVKGIVTLTLKAVRFGDDYLASMQPISLTGKFVGIAVKERFTEPTSVQTAVQSLELFQWHCHVNLMRSCRFLYCGSSQTEQDATIQSPNVRPRHCLNGILRRHLTSYVASVPIFLRRQVNVTMPWGGIVTLTHSRVTVGELLRSDAAYLMRTPPFST